MTIAQGIAFNALKKLKTKRIALVRDFNRLATNHRDISGMYIPGKHSGADYLFAEIKKIDAKIKHWQSHQ